MSEYEKQQRASYQKKRNMFLSVFLTVTAVFTVALIICGAGYIKTGKDSFISYSEEGNVVYKAYLADNEFYTEEYLNGSHAYVSSLIEKMTADFSYGIKMETNDVTFKYSYDITAQLEITDKASQKAIYNPTYTLKEPVSATVSDSVLSINDSVEIDYNKYNKIAKDFITAYSLGETEENLIVRMNISLVGQSHSFAENKSNSYSVELYIPLNSATVTPYVSTPDQPTDNVLVIGNSRRETFKMFTIIFALCDLVAIVITLLFAALTKDKHIDYARRVQNLVSSYKSYIQKINTPFDMTDYQVLNVDTFTQMLEIRDTVLRPILMYENEDKTFTDFFITDGKIVYLYKVSVSDDFSESALSSLISKSSSKETVTL